MRTRGWWTADPDDVAFLVEKYGVLSVGEQGELMVMLESEQDVENLSDELKINFDDQVFIAP